MDLRFRNTTDDYLVIQARTDGKDAIITLYGKKPRWTVQVDKPVIDQVVKADQTPVRQPDSTLAPGQELQIERAEDGFRATIVRRIVEGGQTVRTERFVSTYRPSRNVILVGSPPAPPAAAQELPQPPPADQTR